MTDILSPKDVQKRFGKKFSRGFFTLVDEKNGVAQVIEQCTAKGPVEWDALNRKRAGGVVKEVFVDGDTLIMNTKIGEGDVKFGPASSDLGGQALKALKVVGNEVHTTWLGLAGASVGVGACLPQAPGVLHAIYPNLKEIGGANQVEITIVTRKMKRLIIGIDDTDSKEKGASWVLMLELMKAMPFGKPLKHKIIQLNPKVPEKTTSCVSIAASFAVEDQDLDKVEEFAKNFLKKNTQSKHTSMAIFEGLEIPEEIRSYGLEAKSRIISIHEAETKAKEHGIKMIEVTGKRGKIGALAAIGCFDLGLRAAGLPEDFL
jgi:methanogenesis imperfect marker protein 11